jgi:hypothetical protein
MLLIGSPYTCPQGAARHLLWTMTRAMTFGTPQLPRHAAILPA